MSEERPGLRGVPPLLLTAFAIEIAFVLAHLVQRAIASSERYYDGLDRWGMASHGVWAVFTVMVSVGLFDLSRRLVGRAAIATRVAGIAMASVFALATILDALQTFELLPRDRWFFTLEGYVFWAVSTASTIALAIAAAPRDRVRAIAATAICLIAYPPAILGEATYGALGLGPRAAHIFYACLQVARLIALLVLVVGATDRVAAPRQELAAQGFGQTASALWLRVIAAATAMVFTLAAVATVGRGSFAIVKFAMIGALAVNLISFAMFGLGAMRVARSELDGVPRYAAALAGAASLWCAGVMLEQLPHFYDILYHRDSFGSSGQERLQALSVAMPIVGTLSCAVFAGVIAAFGRARNDEMLGARARGAGTAYVLLMLSSVAISSYLVEKAGTQSAMIGMLIVAAGCGLWAQLVLAKVCRAASFVLEMEPGLPQATARLNDPT